MNHSFKLILTIVSALVFTGYLTVATDYANAKPADSQTKSSKSSKNKKNNKPVKSLSDMKESMLRTLDAYRNKQYGTALTHCEKAMESMPESLEADSVFKLKMMCMDLYTQNSRHNDALKLAAEIRKLPLSQEQKNTVCFSEATTLTRLQRWEDAKLKYDECPGKTDEAQAIVASNVAELSMIQGDPQTAVEKYKQSIEKYPENPHALFGLAVAQTRTRDFEGARKSFVQGVSVDPGFTYLKEAFFAPTYDEDYETAVRLMMIHREHEAKFYLERYLKNETRLNYRAIAEEQIESLNRAIQNHQTALIGTYPVQLDNIELIAIDDSGKKLAFSSEIEPDEKKIKINMTGANAKPHTDLWTIDLETGNATRRMQLEYPEIISAINFVNGSSKLRVLGKNQRYELDVDLPESGYWCFDNNTELNPITLNHDADEIIYFDTDERLTMTTPWNSPWTITKPESHEVMPKVIVYKDRSLLVESPNISKESINTFINNLDSSEFTYYDIDFYPGTDLFALPIQSGTLLINASGEFTVAGAHQNNLKKPNPKAAFSHNGRYLATYSDSTNSLEIWDVSKLTPYLQKP